MQSVAIAHSVDQAKNSQLRRGVLRLHRRHDGRAISSGGEELVIRKSLSSGRLDLIAKGTATDWIYFGRASHFFKASLTFTITADPFSLGFISAVRTEITVPLARVINSLTTSSTYFPTFLAPIFDSMNFGNRRI